MAQIQFLAGEGFNLNTLGSLSGLGFYGSNFGYSIPVGNYQDTTFITNSTGTSPGPQVDNCKYLTESTVKLGSSVSGVSLLAVPNYLSTLNIRFTNDNPVQLHNIKFYGFDRFNKNNAPSGLIMQGAIIIHPDTTQVVNGSGSAAWINMAGSGGILDHPSSPGTSGLSPNGPGTSDTRHDMYLALSCSPNSVGAKTFGLWTEVEFI